MIKHIPFVAFPRSEQNAVLAALLLAGVAPQGVCVSRIEWDDAPQPQPGRTFTTVTAPGLCRTYPAGVDLEWISALAIDLARAQAATAAPLYQS